MAQINNRPNSMAGGAPLKMLKDKMTALRNELEDSYHKNEELEKKCCVQKEENDKVFAHFLISAFCFSLNLCCI